MRRGRLKQRYQFPGNSWYCIIWPQRYYCKYETKKTNPDVRVVGGDENYLELNGYELSAWKKFYMKQMWKREEVFVLSEMLIAQKLYGDNTEKAIDKIITVANNKYRVIGVLKDKGSSAFLECR